jgi:ubiquinone/menaquinone biosynthesis C-methylase UbiE
MNDVPESIQASIKKRYANIARSPSSEKDFPVGPASAKSLGYPAEEIDSLPMSVTESFAGVGNPFSLGEIKAGEIVLDLGCGSGMDSIFAARRVGPEGKCVGIDMTHEMIEKAQGNAEALGVTNVEFRHGTIEALPLENGSVDVAISNGVFNLCIQKQEAVTEIFRVLRAGGRLLMADILLEDHVTPDKVQLMGSWSG